METSKTRQIKVYSKNTVKSKYYVVMKIFFQSMLILSCLDFGFYEYKSFCRKVFWKSVTIIQAIAIYCYCLFSIEDYFENLRANVRATLFLSYYMINVLTLVLMKSEKSFCKLHHDLEAIDLMLHVDNASYNLEMRIFYVALSDYLIRIAVCITICFTDHSACLDPLVSGLLYFWIAISMDSVHLACSFVFYSVYCRLKKLTSILKERHSDFGSLHVAYKAIVELAEAYKEAFDPLFIITLMFNVPEVMVNIYYTVEKVRHENIQTIMEGFLNDYIPVAIGLWITVTPAICAGMLTSQVDRMLLVLHEKLMETQDETEILRIEQFIRYVEERACRFRVFKVFPLDADLTGMVLNFWITYLIIIIEFSDKKEQI